MKSEFNDIFEAINIMHKKYSSKEYLENIDNFSNNSKELENILEKYNVNKPKAKHKKVRLFKKTQRG